MTKAMARDEAVSHVEGILSRWIMLGGGGAPLRPEFDYGAELVQWDADDVRIAEVDFYFHPKDDPEGLPRGGACYMQSDLPHGLAACAAVERWIVALMLDEQVMIRDHRAEVAFLLRDENAEDRALATAGEADELVRAGEVVHLPDDFDENATAGTVCGLVFGNEGWDSYRDCVITDPDEIHDVNCVPCLEEGIR